MMRLYSVSGFYYVVSQLVCMDTTGPCYTMAMKHYCAKASQSVAYLKAYKKLYATSLWTYKPGM